MNKISWLEIQNIFPEASAMHKEKFTKLFAKLGKLELTSDDIDSIIKTPKKAEFTRMFYDSVGQVLGRIDTDDAGDSRCYDKLGNYMGSTFGGQTLNSAGEIVAHSDVLSSLLFREERVTAVSKEDMHKYPDKPWLEGKHCTRCENFLKEESFPNSDSDMCNSCVEDEREGCSIGLNDLRESSKKQANLDEFISKWNESRAFRIEALEHAELKTDLTSDMPWEKLEKHIQRYIYGKWMGLYVAMKRVSRVVQRTDGWHVLSEKGKNLGGPYKTKAEAVKRLRQVEYFKHHGIKKSAGTELWQTADGKWWLLSTVTMTQVGPFFNDKFKAVEYAVDEKRWTPDAGKRVFDNPQPDGVGDPEMFETEHSSCSTNPITLAHVIDAVGIDYTELEERAEDYVPVSTSRGKYRLYEIVNTPFGKGRIITRQTESKPYSYGVRITNTDEVEIVDEKDIKRTKKSTTMNRETQQSYSLDSIIGSDDKKKSIDLNDVIDDYKKSSILKVGADIQWIIELWKKESEKVMKDLVEESPEFADEYATGHIPLHEEYSTHDLKRVTVPYMEGSISKDQAEKLLRDLLYQFREKLYTDHGLSHEQVVKDKENEEVKESSQDQLPAYGTSDIYPYSGTGAGMPSSGDLSRIINDTPSRNIQVK